MGRGVTGKKGEGFLSLSQLSAVTPSAHALMVCRGGRRPGRTRGERYWRCSTSSIHGRGGKDRGGRGRSQSLTAWLTPPPAGVADDRRRRYDTRP